MEMARILPIFVQFGIGALLCAVGIWAGLRGGYLDWKHPEDKRLLVIIAAGYLGLLVLSCAFTFWLPFLPEGGQP